MGGRLIEISSEGTEVALVGGVIKTVLEVTAPTNIHLVLVAYSISFDGIVVTNPPGEITLVRKSVAGTGTAVTERDWDPDKTGTIQAAGRVNMSAEGTITFDFQPRNIHPQNGYEIWLPEGKEIPIPAAGILGLRVLIGNNVNASAFMVLRE